METETLKPGDVLNYKGRRVTVEELGEERARRLVEMGRATPEGAAGKMREGPRQAPPPIEPGAAGSGLGAGVGDPSPLNLASAGPTRTAPPEIEPGAAGSGLAAGVGDPPPPVEPGVETVATRPVPGETPSDVPDRPDGTASVPGDAPKPGETPKPGEVPGDDDDDDDTGGDTGRGGKQPTRNRGGSVGETR
jgi:translation initiation factor IF-2